jgi:hypothetical protein
MQTAGDTRTMIGTIYGVYRMVSNTDLKTAGGNIRRSSVLAFLNRFPVVSMSSPLVQPAVDLKPIVVPPPPMSAAPSTTRAPTEDDYDIIVKAGRVKYLTVSTHADFRATAQSPALGDNASAAIASAVTPGVIPVFWLPYDLNHHRRLTLVPPAGLPAPPGNPRLFLTDMIDGCSIYVEGTPDAPTVSHLNANKVLPVGITTLPPVTDQSLAAQQVRVQAWNLKWANMDNRYQNNPKPRRVANADPALIAGRKLESRHYMFATENDRLNYSGQIGTLQAANVVPANLMGQSVDEIEALFTQGTVFGVLDSANRWHFYVQRRVLLQLFHVTAVPVPVPAPGMLTRLATTIGRAPAPVMGPPAMTVTKTLLGTMWIIRSVNEFWPGTGIGTAAP